MIVTGPASETYPSPPPTFGALLRSTSSSYADEVALVDGRARLAWSEVETRARELAKAFLAQGVEPGDRVAVWLPNRIEWPLVWWALARIGAVLVPVNSRYKHVEAAYILEQSGSRLLLMQRSFLGLDYAAELAQMGTAGDRVVVVLDEPVSGRLAFADFVAGGAAVSDDALVRAEARVTVDMDTIIVYTSGTTGQPKGAVHTQRVLRHAHSIAERLQVSSAGVVLGHMPFFHVAGAFGAALVSLATGAKLVLMDRWDVEHALTLVERERVSVLGGIATHFIDLLSADLTAHDVSSLRSGWIGGATNPPEVIAGALDRLGMAGLLPVYGMTETAATTTMPLIGESRQRLESGTGLPISDFELSVRAVTDDRELGPDEEGQICVRGHNVMRGYFRMPAETAAVIDEDGWFHTGDLGRLAEDGYLSITGRLSDMFIVGGSNAYPTEIEKAIASLPGVTQVCVVGAPHPRLGEVGHAYIEVLRGSVLDEADVRRHCQRLLANFKVPERVTFVESWPLTDTGKIQRAMLKDDAARQSRASARVL